MKEKRFRITIVADEFYLADSLREMANVIENDDNPNGVNGLKGLHYSASISEVNMKKFKPTVVFGDEENAYEIEVKEFDSVEKAQAFYDELEKEYEEGEYMFFIYLCKNAQEVKDAKSELKYERRRFIRECY